MPLLHSILQQIPGIWHYFHAVLHHLLDIYVWAEKPENSAICTVSNAILGVGSTLYNESTMCWSITYYLTSINKRISNNENTINCGSVGNGRTWCSVSQVLTFSYIVFVVINKDLNKHWVTWSGATTFQIRFNYFRFDYDNFDKIRQLRIYQLLWTASYCTNVNKHGVGVVVGWWQGVLVSLDWISLNQIRLDFLIRLDQITLNCFSLENIMGTGVVLWYVVVGFSDYDTTLV